jgi:hypothetical protein
MTTTPYQFIKRGNLFVIPVGPSISEVPYPTQTLTKPKDYSLWVRGAIEEPEEYQVNQPTMPPSVYRDVRADLVRFSPVPVTRSAFRRSEHAYVGVIDSKGTPYYFALDSRGISVRERDQNDEKIWKTFARLAEEEHMTAVRERRETAAREMERVDRELSEPLLIITKGLHEDEGRRQAGNRYAAEMRRAGAELAEQCGEEDLDPPREDDVDKALPRKSKEEKVKKKPTSKASKKQAGAGGKTRYTYPNEKKGGKPGSQQVPLVVEHDDSKHADPAEFANQLGVSVRTLQRTAKHLGRDGFTKFMRSHLKRFSAKHRLDPDYWGTLYDRLREVTQLPQI